MLAKKILKSPVGEIVLIASPTGLRELIFGEALQRSDIAEDEKNAILQQCERELTEYFEGRRTNFSVPLEPQGTVFQKEVWSALLKIPYGQITTYGEQADGMGKKSSIRAVAAANGRNPIGLMIPCHRVIAATGHLHGYAGGLPRKQKLLEIEGLKIQNFKIER